MSLNESRTVCSQATALKLEKCGWDVDKLIQSEVSTALREAKDTPKLSTPNTTTPEEELRKNVGNLKDRYGLRNTDFMLDEDIDAIMQLFKDYIKKRDAYVLGLLESPCFSCLDDELCEHETRDNLREEQRKRAKQYDSGDKL